MPILLTITESQKQLVSGIPEYLTLTTNKPANIFYTYDGSDPDTNSFISADGIIKVPTENLSVVIKIFASDSIESTDIYEQSYSQTSQLYTRRFSENDGISILPSGSEPVEYLSVDLDGNEAQQTAIPFIDLDLKPSSRDKFENYPRGKTAVDFINFTLEIVNLSEIYQDKVSSPSRADFDPTAGLIIVDGFTEQSTKSQIVKVINRPYNTMNTVSSFYNEHMRDSPPVFGNLVRYFVNRNTGKMVFYYYDSRECRWIESHQKLEAAEQTNLIQTHHTKFTFPWIEDPVMTKIY